MDVECKHYMRLMIIDIDTCAWEDIMAALIKPTISNNGVMFYSSKYKRRETARLINATGTNLIVRKVQDIDRFIRLQMNPEGIYDTNTICNFCDKDTSQVKKLLAGNNGIHICNECVDLCHHILDKETNLKMF